MSKIDWLSERAKENDGYFQGKFEVRYCDKVSGEALRLGALWKEVGIGQTAFDWTSFGIGYSLHIGRQGYKGNKRTITLEVFELDLTDDLAKSAEERINLVRGAGHSDTEIAKLEVALLEVLSE